MNRSFLCLLATPLLAVALSQPAGAQQRMLAPDASPRAQVAQTVGITHVSVDYSRPGVKGRDVFADPNIVPVGGGQLWRAGANENTVVSFDRDVSIEGKALPAGSYGLHIAVAPSGPWTAIFSKNTKAWGSYTYDPSEDALRVQVTPTDGPAVEWLRFSFEELDQDGATLVLAWDTKRVPLHIGVDTKAHMVAYLNDEYTRGYGFWSAPQLTQAAQWCANNDVNHEQALTWATRGAQAAPNFTSLWVKSSLEDALGKTEAAKATLAQAQGYANEAQMNQLGYQLMGAGKLDKALTIFAANLEQNPQSWNAHDSLAEALAAKGETERAIELYTKAREMAPDDMNKQRIDQVLATLRG